MTHRKGGDPLLFSALLSHGRPCGWRPNRASVAYLLLATPFSQSLLPFPPLLLRHFLICCAFDYGAGTEGI